MTNIPVEVIKKRRESKLKLIPSRYKNVSLEDIPKNIKDLFLKIKETRKGIYIYGGVGVGKTHILYSMYKQCDEVEVNLPTRFRNVTEMLQDFRDEFNRPYSEKERPQSKIINVRGVVFLDDLGAEKVSEWVGETLYSIINYRYNNMLPTVISSNFSLSELSERIGDRTVSRIAEMCDVVKLEGKDRRIK